MSKKQNKLRKACEIRFATANFLSEMAMNEFHESVHSNFTEFFEVLMGTDEANDPDFRQQAIMMLMFTRMINKHFSGIDWKDIVEEARRMFEHSEKDLKKLGIKHSLNTLGHE